MVTTVSRITVRFGDAYLNFGFDRAFNGYWGDIVPRHDNPDEVPSHEFPDGYPLNIAASLEPILASFEAAGYRIPATAIIALRGAGHSWGDQILFTPDGKQV